MVKFGKKIRGFIQTYLGCVGNNFSNTAYIGLYDTSKFRYAELVLCFGVILRHFQKDTIINEVSSYGKF